MHQYGVDAEALEPHHVVQDRSLFANRAADFDDDRLAHVSADIRQRLEQRFGLLIDRQLGQHQVEYALFSTTYASVRSHPQARAEALPRPRSTRMWTSEPRICARAS